MLGLQMSGNKKTTKVKKAKLTALLRKIINTAISLVILNLVILAIYPHVNNAVFKIQQIDLYRIGYRATFTILNEITPLAHEQTADNPDSTNLLGANTSLSLQKIQFSQTRYEQKNLDTNIFEIDTNMEEKKTRMRIPSVGINGPIVDGRSEQVLTRGFWFLPISAKPGAKGNTVIIGHRFLKIPPSKDTFFNLDKVSLGDQIEVEQQGHLITYTIVEKKVINPKEREVIYPTNDYRITLVTCAPLWESTKRLVVVGIQNEVEQAI